MYKGEMQWYKSFFSCAKQTLISGDAMQDIDLHLSLSVTRTVATPTKSKIIIIKLYSNHKSNTIFELESSKGLVKATLYLKTKYASENGMR